jgi:hypothetical protein
MRICNNCDWEGDVSDCVYVGAIGPLCPECHETTAIEVEIMQEFIGTKIIKAEPCPAWKPFGAHQEGAEGYKVEYEDGYVSWSPKDVFEAAYRPTSGMSFGLAIEAMKKGRKVARVGWNGKGMWLHLVRFYGVIGGCAEGSVPMEQLPYIQMKTVDDKLVPWLASQTDMLADDWQIAE